MLLRNAMIKQNVERKAVKDLFVVIHVLLLEDAAIIYADAVPLSVRCVLC